MQFYAGALEEFQAVGEAILPSVNYALDAGLYDEFGAFDAGRVGDVERSAAGVVARAGNLRYGIGFGVQHIGFGKPVLVLANVLEAGGRAVVAVADNHLVLHDERTHLAARAI